MGPPLLGLTPSFVRLPKTSANEKGAPDCTGAPFLKVNAVKASGLVPASFDELQRFHLALSEYAHKVHAAIVVAKV